MFAMLALDYARAVFVRPGRKFVQEILHLGDVGSIAGAYAGLKFPIQEVSDMKKVILLAAMLAMVLVAAAPALAQAVGGDVNVQYVDCSQVAAVAATQGQYGDATATSGNIGSAAEASIANELGISIEQVNACLGGIETDIIEAPEVVVPEHKVVVHEEEPVVHEHEVVVEHQEPAPAPAPVVEHEAAPAPIKVLPDTGGASFLTLGAGALLIAGGLLVRRIVR